MMVLTVSIRNLLTPDINHRKFLTEKRMLTDKNASKLFRTACLFLIAGLVASCGSSYSSHQQDKKKEVLAASVEAFNSSFRWEDYKSASVWIDPERKELFWDEVDKFKGKIHLTDFQIRDIAFSEKTPVATAIVYFQYYRTDSPTLVTVNFPQKWFFSEKDKCWRLGQSGYEAITKGGKGL